MLQNSHSHLCCYIAKTIVTLAGAAESENKMQKEGKPTAVVLYSSLPLGINALRILFPAWHIKRCTICRGNYSSADLTV